MYISLAMAPTSHTDSSNQLVFRRFYQIFRNNEREGYPVNFRCSEYPGYSCGVNTSELFDRVCDPLNEVFSDLDVRLRHELWQMYFDCKGVLSAEYPEPPTTRTIDTWWSAFSRILVDGLTNGSKSQLDHQLKTVAQGYLNKRIYSSLVTTYEVDGHSMMLDRAMQVKLVKVKLLDLMLAPILSELNHLFRGTFHQADDYSVKLGHYLDIGDAMRAAFFEQVSPGLLDEMAQFYGEPESVPKMFLKPGSYNLKQDISSGKLFFSVVKCRVTGVSRRMSLEAKALETKEEVTS